MRRGKHLRLKLGLARHPEDTGRLVRRAPHSRRALPPTQVSLWEEFIDV
jgi:hypothetical protein